MITINIIAVGSLKEDYFVKAVKEYEKRLSAFVKLNIIEIKESLLSQNPYEQEILKGKQEEAILIREKMKGFSICLEIGGKEFSSESFAQKLNELTVRGVSEISFIIGGSYGLDATLSKSASMQLSFSHFTFPHQLMRVILLEQIYRATCINHNKIYHK